ncbi:hypothetical protein SCACP_40360 [Sporomusa carbonis]
MKDVLIENPAVRAAYDRQGIRLAASLLPLAGRGCLQNANP